MKKEENHVSIKAKHWTVAARSFLTLTTNVKHTIRKLCGPLEGDAPVSPSAIPPRYPGGGAAPVPVLLGTIPTDKTAGAFAGKQLRGSLGGAGSRPPGPLPGITGTLPREQRTVRGLSTCRAKPRPCGRDHGKTGVSQEPVGVVMHTGACPMHIL